MRVLYIGEPETYLKYKKGIVPSHWLYGAVEMEKDGHEVIWEKESPDLMHDLQLIRKYNPDIVFIPNLNIEAHKLLLLLKNLGFVRKPVYAYLHHGKPDDGSKRARIVRWLLRGVNHLFFLSSRSMEETATKGSIERDRCSVPGWGPDMEFYSKVKVTSGEWFVSTGKENRDFEILIEAFRITGAPLRIMTSRGHSDQNYEWLEERCKDIPNIELEFLPNSGDSYPRMLEEMAKAKALVCPLLQDKLNYCVGLSTIADVAGLRKPVIVTENAYHDFRYSDNCIKVTTVKEWIFAINNIQSLFNCNTDANWDMISAYTEMRKRMNL